MTTMLYSYKKEDAKLYIHYPHFTESVKVEAGFDGEEYAVFEDEFALNEFLGYLDDHDLDTSELNIFSSGDAWDSNALKLSDLF